jgi:hypothetical protein
MRELISMSEGPANLVLLFIPFIKAALSGIEAITTELKCLINAGKVEEKCAGNNENLYLAVRMYIT